MKRLRKGFTLVEVIVTLVVLGIIAAIAIPAMTHWIDDAKEKTCSYNRSTLMQRFITYRTFERISLLKAGNSDFMTMYQDDGLSGGLSCPSKGQYSYASGAVCCSVHGGTTVWPLILKDALATVLNANKFAAVDSNAPNIPNDKAFANNTTKVLAQLAASGFDISTSTFQSWGIRPNGVIYLSDQPASADTLGQKIRVIRYNSSLDTYTVGYCSVATNTFVDSQKKSYTYYVIKDDWQEYKGSAVTQTTDTKKSYETGLDFLSKIPATR